MQFENVSPQQFQELKQKLTTTHQASIDGTNAGQIMGHGVVANYAYSAATQTLDVSVQHHPFFIPESSIYHQLDNALNGERKPEPSNTAV